MKEAMPAHRKESMVSSNDPLLLRDRWARLRFVIVGPLLAAPPKGGELKAALTELAQKTWLHPRTAEPVRFGFSTLEKWLYAARRSDDPVHALRERPRGTAGKTISLSAMAVEELTALYQTNPNWSVQLLADNLRVVLAEKEPDRRAASYASVRRYMRRRGLRRQSLPQRDTEGVRAARERLETREVRSYEVDSVGALYHSDFHDGSRKVLTKRGELLIPQLYGCIDDHSRLICHLQWYTNEDTETFVHGMSQAFLRRGLPRALMTDNGPAMISGEFTEGLARLGISHNPTLAYCAFMNGKKENFWGRVEGRLMAMLQHEKPLTLDLLNRATQAWVELEYHRERHEEIGTTPLHRYVNAPSLTRECPSIETLRAAFRIQITRKQRRSDGTVSLEARRFEVPNRYRHLDKLTLRYARWDLSHVDLVDPNTDTILCALLPLDKSANADAHRRALENPERTAIPQGSIGVAPLLKKLLADYAATGLPPAFLPTDTDSGSDSHS
jgi:putative transposase